MKTASEILTMSICIQIGCFIVIALGIGGNWLTQNVNYSSFTAGIIIAIGVGVVLIITAAGLSGTGVGLGIQLPFKMEVSVGMVVIVAIYTASSTITALFLASLPYIGEIIGPIYSLIAAVAIVWDIADRSTKTGTGGRMGE